MQYSFKKFHVLTRKLLIKRIIKQFFFIVNMYNNRYLLGLLFFFTYFVSFFCLGLFYWISQPSLDYILYCLLYYNKNLINWYDSHNLSILLLAHVSYCVDTYFLFSYFTKKIFKNIIYIWLHLGSNVNIYNSIVTKANLCIVKITYIYFHKFIFALCV